MTDRTLDAVLDPDCARCRGGGCDWCHNTGRRHVLMPASDADELDHVVHVLGIEDSDTTPAVAVSELLVEIDRLGAEIDALRAAVRDAEMSLNIYGIDSEWSLRHSAVIDRALAADPAQEKG